MTRNLKDLIFVLNGFRKFLIMLLLIAVGIAFRVCNLINGSELVTLLETTAVAFFGANIGEHIAATVAEWARGKSPKKNEDQSSSDSNVTPLIP